MLNQESCHKFRIRLFLLHLLLSPMSSSSASLRESTQFIQTIAELRQWVASKRKSGQTIGVVPTMGALHEGHLSLVRASLEKSHATIVTIFLNPTQFAPHEDLKNYPQTLDRDLEQLSQLGSVTVFAPSVLEMYPTGFTTAVLPPAIANPLEGEKRPGHFSGVATVVLKLLNLTSADFAFLGQKDYQQLLVVTKMVEELNVPTQIIVCPTARDADGLALSSRNVYLSADERQIALTLSRTLREVEKQIRSGQRDSYELIVEMRQMLIDGGVTSVDYAVIANPKTLETPETIQLPVVALVAGHVGKTRLIDNRLIS
jgi:pantoate--beta-alanine ligase